MRFFLTLCLTLFLGISSMGHAADDILKTTDFSKIPILHKGRMKPMESFAKAITQRC